MFGPFMAYAVLYAFILFVAAVAIDSTPMAFVPLFACVGATIFLVAAWSVFGFESYFRRIAIAHLFGAIPAAGLALGFLLLALGEGGPPVGLFDDIFFFTVTVLLGLIPISVGAQIPFWFFRGFFGWQFVRKGSSPSMSFNLRDIFIITFVFAACFGAAQIAANIQIQQFGWFMETATDYVPVTDVNGVQVLDADGFPKFEEVELTGDSLKEYRRREASNVRNRSFVMFGSSIFAAMIGSLLTFPVLTSLFFSREIGNGCMLTGGYIILAIFLFIGLSTVLGVAGPMVVEMFFWTGVAIFCYALAVWLPLMTMREQDIVLTSPKIFERKLAQESGVGDVNEVVEEAEPEDELPVDGYPDDELPVQ